MSLLSFVRRVLSPIEVLAGGGMKARKSLFSPGERFHIRVVGWLASDCSEVQRVEEKGVTSSW